MKKFFLLVFLAQICLLDLTAQVKERLPCIDKEFSVVVHITQDSLGNRIVTEQLIQEAVDTLNTYFAPICVSFAICEFRYIENYWYDDFNRANHWDEMQNLYNQNNRINLYFVREILDPAGACGFATLGGIRDLDEGGIVIKKQPLCMAGDGGNFRTLNHEMGHYFSLLHTFEGSGVELVSGTNCGTAGDGICDTTADPFVEGDDTGAYVNNECRFISGKRDAEGRFYNPIVGNIMSYYPDRCNCGFTHSQYMRMAQFYLGQKGMW
jgi:hypothetical protein